MNAFTPTLSGTASRFDRYSALFFAFALCLAPEAAKALQPEGRVASGRVTDASIHVRPEASAIVLTTPSTGSFFLTRACLPYRVRLNGNTVGVIVSEKAGTDCIEFEQGMALPRNEMLICESMSTDPTSGGICAVTGVESAL